MLAIIILLGLTVIALGLAFTAEWQNKADALNELRRKHSIIETQHETIHSLNEQLIRAKGDFAELQSQQESSRKEVAMLRAKLTRKGCGKSKIKKAGGGAQPAAR